jgi:hypothetical protein
VDRERAGVKACPFQFWIRIFQPDVSRRSPDAGTDVLLHERIRAGLKKITTSDHHPVSMMIEFR